MSSRFSWLHLSDLHIGMKSHKWMWQNVKHQVYDDFRYLQSEHGKWDVVIFSGDLTQKGDAEEFASLTKTLQEMWGVFGEAGFQPYLFCVPGNHDLVRPDALDPVKLALDNWWDTPKLRAAFWTKDGSNLRSTLSKYFENFEKWKTQLKEVGIPLLEEASGVIPGDITSVYSSGDLKVGLVGLNSTWLQLDGEDHKGRLHIDPDQLSAVTDGDATGWAKGQNLNLLVTHHPLDWLHPDSLKIFNQEIDVSGRFGAHLYGHMHAAGAYQQSHLGMQVKRSIQSASLFGLEHFGSNEEDRKHGYSLGIIDIAVDAPATLTLLPRATRDVAGERKIGADYTLPIDNANKIVHFFEMTSTAAGKVQPKNSWIEEKLSDETAEQIQVKDAGIAVNLGVIAKVLGEAKEALFVRAVQLRAACSILEKTRVLWLAAEWGMGEQGFLWAIQKKMSHEQSLNYSLDLSGYSDRNQFFEGVKARYGFSFESICDSLSKLSNPYLIFEDTPFSSNTDESLKLHRDLSNLVDVMLSYCPSLNIIILSRQSPSVDSENILEIVALDQADTRSFVEHHRLGNRGLTSEDYLKIYQHTDGLPNLIETDLRNMRVASLSEVTSLTSEIPLPDGSLNRAMLELSESKEPGMQRAYLLLKILCVFPQGEELGKIKNFDRTKPVFFDHAQILEQRGFIQGVEVNQLESRSHVNKTKRLIATRPVREWVQSKLTDRERKTLDEYAASSYFGASWSIGEFKPPHSLKFHAPGRVPAELDNARSIVQKVVMAALGNPRKLTVAVSLTQYHGAALLAGDYYRSACEFFQYISPLLEGEIPETDKYYMDFLYAKALRMLDGDRNTTTSKDILLAALPHISDKRTLLSVYMNLALCSESLKEVDDAVTYAKKVIALDKSSYSALSAQQIILEMSTEGSESTRAAALSKLEDKARRQGAKSVAVTIALSKAYATVDDMERITQLRSIVRDAKENGDSYDIMRAMIALGKVSLKSNIDFKLTTAEEHLLIRLYHYLYNERFDTLFYQCHEILWKIFTERREYENMLQLFRYSSLLWRLRGKEDLEKKALGRLNNIIGDNPPASLGRFDLATSYFYARLGASISSNDQDYSL
ncbi:metallophosphoesterase [Pseudomonas sp. Irchel s3b6]|uniref:metallophosphoesterase family protein n=1 Tax=Pseudomonas sp. Irchel s3b6 TaxID=2009078 RepID=UPI000BA315EA|nr:metallophosphoesterase [Pseudomonas sp. Irchel s3b6]